MKLQMSNQIAEQTQELPLGVVDNWEGSLKFVMPGL